VLAIALVPSFVLFTAGVGLSSYLLVNAMNQRDKAQLLGQGYQMAVPFMPAMSQERRASILALSDPSPENRAALAQARQNMDGLLGQFSAVSTQVANAMPPTAKASIGDFVAKLPGLVATRHAIDTREASRLGVYRSYNEVADAMIVAAGAIGTDSTDKEAALDRTMASDLMRASDGLDRANSLAAGALAGGGMTIAELSEYNRATQGYHALLDSLAPRLTGAQAQLEALRSSPAFGQLSAVEETIVQQGFSTERQRSSEDGTASGTFRDTSTPETIAPPTLPVSPQDWQNAARDSATGLSTLGLGTLGARAAALEHDSADAALVRSLVAALAMILVVGVVMIIAARLSNKLIRRLNRLRAETLNLADEQLPGVVERLRAGEQIDVALEVPELDHGTDEIGQVAAAFNKAQQTAVTAAVQEAKTREGINAVFLNIARRSQAIVHRQLQVLDKAERGVDDPDQLDLLFQLDHSTTRERRNAENLIILGGGQLGRQWRNSVSLVEIVRGAVAEAEQYTRVMVGRFPDALVDGRAVADLIHLLAELIDNATSFSPPGSRIEVRGNPAGKGVIVEVEDQGLGIEPERRMAVNKMFREPPGFGIMALSDDARIGFFVVAHLASQHGIKVSLMESTYGGVRAGVLIPTTLLDKQGGQGNRKAADQVEKPEVDHTPTGGGPATQESRTTENGATQSQWAEPGVRSPKDAATEGMVSPRPYALNETVVERKPSPRPRDRDERPSLPRRRPQEHLARQLHEELDTTGNELQGEPDFDRAARHSRDAFSAFQRGTRRGRSNDD
jgi:signal transduction histidine kinase